MTGREVRSAGSAGAASERFRIIGLAALVIGGVAFYLFVRGTSDDEDARRNLLPYQVLARTLTEAERQTHAAIRQGLLVAENDRARLGQWPAAAALRDHAVPPFDGTGAPGLKWQEFRRGATINYLGVPEDASGPAWLLAVQEPEPNTPPDPSPNDDEHHRLPDGTTLHIFVWMHRFGGRVAPAFVPQPQADGWIQVFSAPPNPVTPVRP